MVDADRMSDAAPPSVATKAIDLARRNRGVGLATALVMGLLVVLAYAAAVGIERLLGHTGPPGLATSVLVTAVVALAFEPVRSRTRRLLVRLTHADDRSRAQVLAHFLESVSGRYEVAHLPERIAQVVGESTGAAQTEVWVMVDGRLEAAASWAPEGRATAAAEGHAATARHEFDVRDRGDRLGRLVVVMPADHGLTGTERRLIDAVAAQSGLLLRVAGLRVELQRRIDDLEERSADLRRARRALVARQDAERRRLERNIHDGAQQEVIALLVNLRLVQTLQSRAPERAVTLLDAQVAAFDSAVATLEELARGLYPRLLTDQGPVAALRSAARHSPVPVTLSADELPRCPVDVEATLYFAVVEAIQNAAKHAAAQEIRIDVHRSGGLLEIAVTDDGVGFDPAETTPGRGLANIRDRVESVGGRLAVASAPGRGTRLSFDLPVPGGR
jgi:signal transduction histidine kinase